MRRKRAGKTESDNIAAIDGQPEAIKVKKPAKKGKTGDLSLLLLTVVLVMFGTVMIFSASYYKSISDAGDPYVYLKRQVMWAAIGFVGMWIVSKIDYHIWGRLFKVIPLLCVALLALLFTPLGQEAGGAIRWIAVGPITIMMQPNMSTAFTIVFIAGGMLLMSGAKWSHLGILAGGAAVAGVAFIFTDPDGYRFSRITSFLDPFADAVGSGYQVVQSLLAMGTGGLTGLGLGNSIQKNLYLPEPQNDFILAIIGEELGFVGILGLMIVYMILIWRGCHVAMNAKDYMGMMMAAGITIMIGIQVIINIAVVTSSFPPTGVILPFVSYGGNALLIFMGAMGILLNISKSSKL